MNIQKSLKEHCEESLQYFNKNQIVGLFLQGSQNYGLETEKSDVDTKLIVTPTLKEIAMGKEPVSTTHIRANEEHIDFKDIRNYFARGFKKQNINFMEILYTDYSIVNPLYQEQWNILIKNRDLITHMNPYRAVKCMKGMAYEKMAALSRPFPSKIDIIKKYGYDPKQACHLFRMEDFLERYLNEVPYAECLKPSNPAFLMKVKRGEYSFEDIKPLCDQSLALIEKQADRFTENLKDENNPKVEEILDNIQYEIIKKSIAYELKENEK